MSPKGASRVSWTVATATDRRLILTLSPDPPYGLLAHDEHCPYIEGRVSMPLSTPSLDPGVYRHDCLLDERGRLTV